MSIANTCFDAAVEILSRCIEPVPLDHWSNEEREADPPPECKQLRYSTARFIAVP